MQPCSVTECDALAAFTTRTKPAWCDQHITETLALGGIEPLEPFTKPTAWRLTRCTSCGVEAHYRLDYVLEQNRLDTPTCRAGHWRRWYAGGWVTPPAPPAVGTVDRGRVVIAALEGGPVLYRCQNCGRQTANRPGHFISASSSLVEQSFRPASTRRCETQRRSVPRPTSTSGATTATAFVTDPASSTRSSTIRTAVRRFGFELLRDEQHPLELERKRHRTRDASESPVRHLLLIRMGEYGRDVLRV